ncbi:HtaA domain-containing protein [Corynebacterium confusum]|uniref:HtaA domain-containing protein n=1 Tax=Corynebacterium sp. HMSC04H06 TaxID=1581050 RepID=UPI0008A483AB|nr:HtaA domain-containing protein [Corynebacterium sp. HMSC04H06]OFS21386.1 hemin receptor [Corynebacterium sp. HMSC04H06]
MSRISSRSLTAAAVVTAVALGGATVPTALAAEGTAPALESGSFAWPIKDSFISHLRGPFAKGTLTGDNGAEFKENQFVFPVDVENTQLDAEGNGTIPLTGGAHLVAYEGMGKNGGPGLDVAFDDLKLEVAGQNAKLVGDFTLDGRTANDPTQLDKAGDDEVLVTFTFDEPIAPGTDFTAQDRPTTAGIGLHHSLLRYEEGQEFDDANVDLVLDYADGEQGGDVSGKDLAGIDRLSSELATVSSDNPSATGIGTTIGLVLGFIAAVGGAAVALGHFDWRGMLKNFGINL